MSGIGSEGQRDGGQDVSRLRANRRVVLKAVAGMSALAASGIGTVPTGPAPVAAQETDGTRANRYVPSDHGIAAGDAARNEWVEFKADYPFWAFGASWNGSVGEWPVIALQFSSDGATWSETIGVAANTEDGGQPNRDERLFTPLVFTAGEQWVRYQTLDASGKPGTVQDLSFVYIDPTDGPWAEDITPTPPAGGEDDSMSLMAETVAPPEIITRAQWGANESWRSDAFGVIWPPEYETVTHIIIHHTATTNQPADVPSAIRSIYYYHAVEQGWGDIGYNYLVDHNGRIYQGRYGGTDVIGGHSYQFAIGSSGITTIGNFMTVDPTEAAKSALVSICAWVGRDLDVAGTADFHEAPDLPIISSHRDVNATTCPGDRLWNDLPELRQLTKATIDQGVLDTEFAAGIVPGDRVKVQTDDGSNLILRASVGGSQVGTLAQGKTAWVIDGPTKTDNGNWYRIQAEEGGATGWATAQYLIVTPPLPPGSPTTDYPFGLNVRTTSTVNLRRSPSTSAGIVAQVPSNTWAHVLAGPEENNGFTWYQLRVLNHGDGWAVTTAFSPAPFDENPPATFAVGDTVEATSSSSIRPRPGIAQKPIATAGAGTQMVISQEPVAVTGSTWYGVYSTSFGGGWITGDVLKASTPPPAGKFQVNDTIRVTESTNLRSTPSTSGSVLVMMPAGTTGTVLGGPRTANGYTWWNIRTAGGTTGWCIENWLVKTTTTPPPTGKFKINDTFRVSETTNLRSSASTSASVVQTMAAGTTGTVIGGPTSSGGYIWWNVRLSNGTTGWCIENWLVKTTGTPPPTGKFVIGDSVSIIERANFRTGAGTDKSIIRQVTAGESGKIAGGPTNASGYIWWQVTIGGQSGWVIEDVLQKGTTTPPPSGTFPAGTVVRTNSANLRLRSTASTSGTILATLPTGTRLTIVSGPTTGSGYSWYKVNSASYPTGYVVKDFIEKV